MEKWFFINISGVNISDGYPDFYFGSMEDSCFYFKRKFPNHQEFEEILHDKIGAILLKNGVPDYNLVVIVSKPFENLLVESKANERSITLFLYYLNQRIEALSRFLGKEPDYKLVFEIDERVGQNNEGAHGSKYENIHWLDHQPARTPDFKIADSWPEPLINFLKENNSNNSNLQYYARVKSIYFCRISFRKKKHEEYLHYLFSFLQLFIIDEPHKSILTRNSLNELDFEGNDITSYFTFFCKQVHQSLDAFQKKIGEETTEAQILIPKPNNRELDRQLNETAQKLNSYHCSTDGINCSNVENRIEGWISAFEHFSKDIPTWIYDFTGFLNNKSNLIDTNQEAQRGNFDFWNGKKREFREQHQMLSRKISAVSFDEEQFIKTWKYELEEKFTDIKKDIQRCPNQVFMFIVLAISLVFYGFVLYNIASGLSGSGGFAIFFLISTLIYLTVSFLLFFKYRKESINQIKRKVRQLEVYNRNKVSECLDKLKHRANNQTNIYLLGVVNQNIATTGKQLMFFEEQAARIEMIRKRNENISNIAGFNAENMDFELAKEVVTTPQSIYNYIKVFDSKYKAPPIKLYKNEKDQNEDIQKFSHRNNALKAIKITQK